MLETKIQELTTEVHALTSVLSLTLEALKHLQHLHLPPTLPAPAPAVATVSALPAAVVTPAPTATKAQDAKAQDAKAQSLTHEELTDIVLEIVREDRSKRDLVRQTIANHGATTIADIAVDQLPALKLALEALK
jgi:hypothetical protein